MGLQQGSMIVSAYASKFIRLSKYYPSMVSTMESKTRRFMKGLREELQRSLMPFSKITYSEAVEAATRLENEDKTKNVTRTGNSSGKRLAEKH